MRARAVLTVALTAFALSGAALSVAAADPPAAASAPIGAGLRLIMVDRPGCPSCRAWKREILPGYASHALGRAAPLTIVPLDGPWPDGVALARAPFISPTFVLLRDGREITRIEGYAGKRHFWPLVDRMLTADRALAAGAGG